MQTKHVLISADAEYLLDYAPVSVASALKHGHEVILQVIKSPGWEYAASFYAGISGVTQRTATAPAPISHAYTVTRLLALPDLLREHGSIVMIDADSLVRAPLATEHEIWLAGWPWYGTDEDVTRVSKQFKIPEEWARVGPRFSIGGGTYLRGEHGLRFAEAIATEAIALIDAQNVGWFIDQMAVWRAFVATWPPAAIRWWQPFGLQHAIEQNAPLATCQSTCRNSQQWRNLVTDSRRDLIARRASLQ